MSVEINGQIIKVSLNVGQQVIDVRIDNGYLQIKYSFTDWINFIPISDITGPAGEEIEIRNNGTYIQWKYISDSVWIDLIALSDLNGEDGVGIYNIAKTSTVGLVDTYTITYTDSTTSTFDVTNGQDGDDGVGVPTGGTTGQVLVKKSNSDYDTEWQNNSGGLTPEQEEKIDNIDLEGDGTKYLSDDGTYKTISSGGGLTPEQEAKVNAIDIEGYGDKYLSDDGTYKAIDLSQWNYKGTLDTYAELLLVTGSVQNDAWYVKEKDVEDVSYLYVFDGTSFPAEYDGIPTTAPNIQDVLDALESFLDRSPQGTTTERLQFTNRVGYSLHGVSVTNGAFMLRATNTVNAGTGNNSILYNVPTRIGNRKINRIKFNSPRIGGGTNNAHVIGIQSNSAISVLLYALSTITGNIETYTYDVSGFEYISILIPFSDTSPNNLERYIDFEIDKDVGLFQKDIVKKYIDDSINDAAESLGGSVYVLNSINNDYTIHVGQMNNSGNIENLNSTTLMYTKVTPNPDYVYETNLGTLKSGDYTVFGFNRYGEFVGKFNIKDTVNINKDYPNISYFYINLNTTIAPQFYFRRSALLAKYGAVERDSNNTYFTPFEVQHEVVVADFIDGVMTDDEVIDMAINFGRGFPNRKLVFNTKQWNISRSILIPSNTIVEVDGVKIKQVNETFDTLMRGDNLVLDLLNPNGYPLEIKPLENIWIIGKNGASLEGPTVNKQLVHPILGLQDAVGDYWGWRTFTVCFSNTRNVKIEGLSISRPRCYTISFDLCKYGEVSNMVINSSLKNGDGVDLRMGCHNFIIENITGSTSDDTVALNTGTTAIVTFPSGNLVYPLTPSRNTAHLRTCYENSIMNVVIRNIQTTGSHQCVRLLAIGGLLVKNIVIEDVKEETIGRSSFIHISTGYGTGFKENDISNVRLKNIISNSSSNGGSTLTISVKSDNIWADNLQQLNTSASLTSIADMRGITITNS